MNIHEIDSHVDGHADALESVNFDANADTLVKLQNICTVYQGVRPVLLFAKAILFWRPKWQSFIDKLITSLDTACPQ